MQKWGGVLWHSAIIKLQNANVSDLLRVA